jgi:hypothetical protein
MAPRHLLLRLEQVRLDSHAQACVSSSSATHRYKILAMLIN